MLKTMLKKDWFSYLLRPCHSINITKPLRSRVQEMFKTRMTWQKKDWYLYMIVSFPRDNNHNMIVTSPRDCDNPQLWRLNIHEFCKRRSSLFELVHEFGKSCLRNCVTVGSNLYMVKYSLNKVERYSFDPANSDGQCICRLKDTAAIPRLIDPRLEKKNQDNVIMCTIENKIYVLAKSDQEIDDDHEQPPLFKVFDPLSRTWKHLPYPPSFNKQSFDTNKCSVENHFVWGHKLGVVPWDEDLYIFDTHQEKWECYPLKREATKEISNEMFGRFVAVAEFEGFLIGILDEKRLQLVAYQLDQNGNPKLYRVLHELQGIFCPFLNTNFSECYLGEFDGGRMWLVQTNQLMRIDDDYFELYTRIAVFQVSISNDLAGNPILSAHIEAAEFYDDLKLSTAFVRCHHLNKHDTENKVLCGSIVPHAC